MTSAITRLKLLGDRADELTKWQADVEMREAEYKREQAQKKREAERQREEQQQAAARNSADWYARVDERIQEHLRQNFLRDAEGNFGPLSSMMTRAIGDALGHNRAELRKEFVAAIGKLREEFRIGMGRVPIAKTWDPDAVCYVGDVVSYGGETFQALQDTGKTPAADHPHWRLLARRGRDAISPRIRGAFDGYEKYRALDIVEYDGSAFIAVRDLDPGTIPGEKGWQLLARGGGRGPVGDVGPRGQRGARGPRGEDSPQIIGWVVDPVHYRVALTMSDGKAGPVLDLRPLFERYNAETS